MYRAGAGVASVALLLTTGAPVLAGSSDVTIQGNGADSNNKAAVIDVCVSKTTQVNQSETEVFVGQGANTGGNTASKNTGGDVDIDTGNATNEVDITLGGSSNTADSADCCECDSETTATIKNNGNRSRNKLFVGSLSWTSSTQVNQDYTGIAVLQGANTGKNKAKKNTGKDKKTSIKTGKASNSFSMLKKPPRNKI